MEVRLIAEGGYLLPRHLKVLEGLGFQFQKEFTSTPGPVKTHWVAANSPKAKIDIDTLVEVSRAIGAPLSIEHRCASPIVRILKSG